MPVPQQKAWVGPWAPAPSLHLPPWPGPQHPAEHRELLLPPAALAKSKHGTAPPPCCPVLSVSCFSLRALSRPERGAGTSSRASLLQPAWSRMPLLRDEVLKVVGDRGSTLQWWEQNSGCPAPGPQLLQPGPAFTPPHMPPALSVPLHTPTPSQCSQHTLAHQQCWGWSQPTSSHPNPPVSEEVPGLHSPGAGLGWLHCSGGGGRALQPWAGSAGGGGEAGRSPMKVKSIAV